MAKAQLNVTVALSKEKVADMIEQVLLGQNLTYEHRPQYKQGFVDGVSAVVRFLRALEQGDSE
jgi:hypothetical protein